MISTERSTLLPLLFRRAALGEVTFLKHRATRGQTHTRANTGNSQEAKREAEGGVIVFEWVYMCIFLRYPPLNLCFPLRVAVPLLLSVIPPIAHLFLLLSPSVPLRITGVCQSPIREGCWVMGENRSALLWSPGPRSARLPHTRKTHISGTI